jgi:uncharacterized protein
MVAKPPPAAAAASKTAPAGNATKLGKSVPEAAKSAAAADGANKPNKKAATLEASFTPIMAAANNGHADVIRVMYEHPTARKFDPDVLNANGSAALHLAARNGHAEAIRALITYGKANVNRLSSMHQTALMEASAFGKVEAAKTLLELGAVLDVADAVGATALMLAAQSDKTAVMTLLLAAGAQFDKATPHGL